MSKFCSSLSIGLAKNLGLGQNVLNKAFLPMLSLPPSFHTVRPALQQKAPCIPCLPCHPSWALFAGSLFALASRKTRTDANPEVGPTRDEEAALWKISGTVLLLGSGEAEV